MGNDQGNREDEGQEYLQCPAEEIDLDPLVVNDPLAELAINLAICLQYLEDKHGGFCDYCTCQLGFHATMDDGGCELCGCAERELRLEHSPLTKILPSPARRVSDPDAFWRLREANTRSEGYNRAKEARNALKELTE